MVVIKIWFLLNTSCRERISVIMMLVIVERQALPGLERYQSFLYQTREMRCVDTDCAEYLANLKAADTGSVAEPRFFGCSFFWQVKN